jgi:phytoene synthase
MEAEARMASGEERDEIRTVARAFEYERYLAALLMPRNEREPLVLLAAFSAELRRVPSLVTEPMMGSIRLQWWRDALDAAAGGGDVVRSGNPLADALAVTVRRHDLPWGLLQGMIDAAEYALDPTPFQHTAETRQYLIKREAALFELSGRVAGARPPREVWANAGLAYGAFRCAVAYDAARRHGAQTFLSREVAEPAADETGEGRRWFAERAAEALGPVRAAAKTLGRPARRVLLPLAIIEPFLRRSSSAAERPFGGRPVVGSGIVEPSRLARATRLLLRHWRGGF